MTEQQRRDARYQQYTQVQTAHPGRVYFFKVGNSWEVYGPGARIAAGCVEGRPVKIHDAPAPGGDGYRYDWIRLTGPRAEACMHQLTRNRYGVAVCEPVA